MQVFNTIKKLTLFSAFSFACFAIQAQTDSARSIDVTRAVNTNLVGTTVIVTGTITEAATAKPLQGIRITYRDLYAAITDASGNFSIKVPNYDVAISVEGDGYQSKEIAIKGRRRVVASIYEDGYNSFYDLAVLPFGSKPKAHTPFAVTSIATGGNWSQVTETPDSYLQGRVAGLHTVRRSGTPNAGANLFLRGYSSLYGNTQPLIVIDGIITDNIDLGGSIISGHHTNSLSFIDARDIDNVTVIKDGSSTYGTKGGNGVIMISTARARELGTKIDLAVFSGVNYTPSFIPVLNAADYRVYLSEVLKSSGLSDGEIKNTSMMNDDPNNPNYYNYHYNTDWQKQVFEKSLTQNIYLKVTGGDNIAKYALSLGFLKNAGVTQNTNLRRYNMRFNGDLNLSRRLTAQTNLSLTFNDQNIKDQGLDSKTNPIFVSLTKAPFLPFKEVSPTGIESPELADSDTLGISNPRTLIERTLGITKSYRFMGTIGLDYEFSKAVHLRSAIGVITDNVRENFFVPRKGVANDSLRRDVADSRLGSQVKRLFTLFNETRLSYDKTYNRVHQLSANLGLRYLNNKYEQDSVLSFNSATDDLISVGTGVALLRDIGGGINESRWLNTFLNTDYSYANKYFFSFNLAMDGSSRFGKRVDAGGININGNTFAYLPSIAAAWLISSEDYMTDSKIDLLKLRASVGLSGNDDIGNYTARQYYVSQNLLGVQGLTRGSFGNPALHWEEMRKLNLGLDVALFNERINISLDAFSNETDKMLLFESAPRASGFKFIVSNSGGMRSNGLEASVNARLVNKGNFKWDMGFNISKFESRIFYLPVDRIYTRYANATILTEVGADPNLFFGHTTNGVFASDAIAAQEGLSIRLSNGSLMPFKGGDIRFNDLNKDKIIDDADRQVIGNPNPDMFGGISNQLSYKKFSLDALFTFSKGNDIYNYTRYRLESLSGVENQTQTVQNRWRTNGQITDVPKISWNDPMGNSRFSDRWIEDGSYLRLRTLTLSYSIPFKQGLFKYSVLYLTGNNLFTLTKYKGFDPEFSASEGALRQGIDITLEPQYRSVQLGARIGL